MQRKKLGIYFTTKIIKFFKKTPCRKKMIFLLSPVDISDHNIPNGNSIFLMNCKKLEAITGESKWQNMVKELMQSFHSFLNLHASQMISYIKNLDMCEDSNHFTFFGNISKNLKIYINT